MGRGEVGKEQHKLNFCTCFVPAYWQIIRNATPTFRLPDLPTFPLRFNTYSKHHPSLLDSINVQELLDQLGDFLLESGFAGGQDPYWGYLPGEDSSHSMDDLKQAIMRALMESGKLTGEMLQVLRGETTGDAKRDQEIETQIAELLDHIIEKLVEDGYLTAEQSPQMPEGYEQIAGQQGAEKAAAKNVSFNLSEKGLDFLGYRSLKHLMGGIGKANFGSHDTAHLSTGVEAEAVSRPYEFGDTMNIDVSATLQKAIEREGLGVPINIEYGDLMVHQSEYRSSAATVLMLDCSHSMILYGEDRFTPAKKVALALTHLIKTQFPGDTIRVVLFHDTAEEIPISQLAKAQIGPYHTNTAEGLKLARKILMSQKKDMRQIIMITDGKPTAVTLPNGDVYINSMGFDPRVLEATFKEVNACKKSRIQINTFMLARERSLVQFVQEMSEMCKGKAYFTNTMTLGQYILMDFMKRKTKRV